MTKIKLEHIDNLSRWKKSWARIGSRTIAHHLFAHEQIHYEQALRQKYLEITDKHRVNLANLWYQVCQVQGWKNYILIKHHGRDTADILLDGRIVVSWERKQMKSEIQSLSKE